MTEILESLGDLPEQSFSAGETLIFEGAVADKVYVLVEGELAVLKGRTEVTRVREPGAVFGEISALIASPTTARVVAVGDVRARVLENAAQALSNHPALAGHTARILAKRLAHATDYLTELKRDLEPATRQFSSIDRVLETLMGQEEKWKKAGREDG